MAKRTETVDVLLDTCALLWLALAPERLSSAAQAILAESSTRLHVSAFSAFEVAIKQKKGKLDLPSPAEVWFPRAVAELGITEVPMTSHIALAAISLEWDHGDPGDRIVVASAQVHGLKLVTADNVIRNFAGSMTVW